VSEQYLDTIINLKQCKKCAFCWFLLHTFQIFITRNSWFKQHAIDTMSQTIFLSVIAGFVRPHEQN